MNETPAATPRVHAGCGHLCLTCGAQAAVRNDRVQQVVSVVLLTAFVLAAAGSLVRVIALAAQEYAARQKPAPPPDVQQYWSDGTPPLQYVNAIAHVQSAFTLIADADGRVAFDMPEGMVCIASAGDAGSLYSAVAGRRRVFWGARPNSVIHVWCW